MADEQQLRRALYDVVPDPPAAPGRARESRVLSGRLRRRRLVTGAALVVVAALAVPVVQSIDFGNHQQPELSGVVPKGQGQPACHQLDHRGAGATIDAQVINAATAVGWLHDIDSSWAGRLGDGSSATVCVLAKSHQLRFTVTVLRPGRQPAVVATGDYAAMASAMTRLGARLQSEAPTTVDAPFRCPDPSQDTNVPLAGSATLPTGAIAVRICGDGWSSPPQSLTTGVDDIVQAVNARPLIYSRGSTCLGTPGAHGYSLVFRYAGGTRAVEGDFCGWMGVGPVQRKDTFPTIGDRVLADLAVQETAHGVVAPAPCPGTTEKPTGQGDPTHIVAARFCPAGATGNGNLLSARQLVRLRTADGRGGGTDHLLGGYTQIEQPCPTPAAGWPHLMLSDAWHEQFSAVLKCRNLRYWEIVLPTSSMRVVKPIIVDSATGLLRRLEATTPR